MIDGTPRLSVRVLGAAEIQVAETALDLKHLKARALLFYLAATGQAHTRLSLATLLWSESGPDNALHSLRTSLYRLRKALRPSQAEDVIARDGELLSLQPDAYQCDVIAFRRLLGKDDESSYSQAVALYGGALLQGFSLPDAPVFDEWVQLEGTRLSQACFEALERLATWAELRQAWDTAIGYVQQMIRLDSLAESAQQRLMQLYLRKGDASLAVRQYRQFENQLQQELSLSPSPETRALLIEALEQQRSPARASNIPAPLSGRKTYLLPFTGREWLLRQLSATSLDVQTGYGATVLLQGEAGIGKSRLLNEFVSHMAIGSPQWLVMQGACSPFDDLLSHGPFLEALQNEREELKDFLEGTDASVPDARGRFSWRVLQTIRSLTQHNALILVIEDLQWANSSTLNLFGFLSMRIHHLPVMLVGTVQHVEAIPALQRLITLGRRRGALNLFSLSPLSLADVSSLLQKAGVEPVSVDSLAGWLHERSAGSPFLLTEILAQLRSEEVLQPAGNTWQVDTIRWLQWRTSFQLPVTTHDLVAWRLTNLPVEAQHLLNILAVAGRPLRENILREFPGIQSESFLALVEDLARRGLIVEAADRMLALPHYLLRETLLHQMSDLRRRAIHRQLAEALEAHASQGDDGLLPQIALHAVAGEDIDRARRYGLRVLADLPQDYTGAETVDFVQHLYDLLAPSGSADEMIRLTRALGALHQSLGHLEVAARWQRENLRWAQKRRDPASQAEAHFEMGELALMINDYHGAAQAAEDGLSIIEADQPEAQLPSLRLHTLIGRGHRLLGAARAMEGSDLTAAENHLREAVVAHRQTGNQGDLCAVLFELGNIAGQRGELQRALDFYAESAQTAEAGGIHYYFTLALNNFAYHCLLLGRIGEAQKSAARGIKAAEASDLVISLVHLYSTQGEIHLYLGEWEEAQETFRRGLSIAEEIGNLERQAGYRGGLALAARGQHDLETGIQLLEEGLDLIAGQGYWHLRARLQLWMAEMLYEQARLDEAAQCLEAALEIARAQRRTLLFVQAEGLHARLLASKGDWTAAEDLFTRTLEMASGLGLPLEIARLQAAWGEAALQHSPFPEQGRSLIASARTVLATHDARADLARLPAA